MKADVPAGTPLRIAPCRGRINCCFQNRKITVAAAAERRSPTPLSSPSRGLAPPPAGPAGRRCASQMPPLDVLIISPWAAPVEPGPRLVAGGPRRTVAGAWLCPWPPGWPARSPSASLGLGVLTWRTEAAPCPPPGGGQTSRDGVERAPVRRRAAKGQGACYSRSSRSTNIPVLPECAHFASAQSAPINERTN